MILLESGLRFKGPAVAVWIDIAWGLQNLGIILENKVPPNVKLAKDVMIKVVHLPKKVIKSYF